jgi:hypothetical protein
MEVSWPVVAPRKPNLHDSKAIRVSLSHRGTPGGSLIFWRGASSAMRTLAAGKGSAVSHPRMPRPPGKRLKGLAWMIFRVCVAAIADALAANAFLSEHRETFVTKMRRRKGLVKRQRCALKTRLRQVKMARWADAE